MACTATDEQVVALSEALDLLAGHDREAAELIKLRFFVGLPNIEAAPLLLVGIWLLTLRGHSRTVPILHQL